MTPSNPLVETNKTLELNCTLADGLEDADAGDIYFMFRNNVIDAGLVHVTAERTATLRFPGATRAHTGHWFCYLPPSNRTGPLPPKVGQQSVTVAGEWGSDGRRE